LARRWQGTLFIVSFESACLETRRHIASVHPWFQDGVTIVLANMVKYRRALREDVATPSILIGRVFGLPRRGQIQIVGMQLQEGIIFL